MNVKRKGCRILSLLLTLAMLFSLLVGMTSCGEEENPLGETYMTIGDVEVPYDMVYCFVKQELLRYSETELIDESIRQQIRVDVMENLVENHYITRVIAKQLDLGLTKDAKTYIKETLKEYRAQKDYNSMLEQMYATEAVLEELMIVDALDTIVYDFLCDMDDRFDTASYKILADIENEGWYAAEVLILVYDDVNHDAREKDMKQVRNEVLSGKTLKDASATIQRLYGTEFKYEFDGCFCDVTYLDEVADQLAKIEIGEVSEVFDTYTDDGTPCLMLLRRQSISESYVEKNFDTVKANYLVRVYDNYKNEIIKDLEVVIVDKYKNNDILDIE